ncbi:MAG: iron ABC transporter substrate-binding protein [Acetobacteraceae bacterium]|nr:iron ABC transporter substrate-binding protein [Acetobacteraceae bacterium]
MRRLLPLLLLFGLLPACGWAATVTDATGRTVTLPDAPTRVLPAGPPAAALLAVIAPDLMIGFPNPVSLEARALLAPAANDLPGVPRVTGRTDVTEALAALHPDLVLDYGDVTPRYTALIEAAQQHLGVPAILLDGKLAATPAALRLTGRILHREARAEMLARLAEALLALPADATPRTVVYARGADGLNVAAPGTESTAVLERLGWRVLAPPGEGWFRATDLAHITALDPDMLIFSDPAMRAVLAKPGPWGALRAVRQGHAYVAPSLPFGWVEEPPSVNRLLGLAWLHGGDPSVVGGMLNALLYDRVLPADALASAVAGTPALH